MKKILIVIYFTIMALIQFGFISLIFYPEANLSVMNKLLLIIVLIYIIIKSSKYKLKITRDVSILTLVFSIISSLVY